MEQTNKTLKTNSYSLSKDVWQRIIRSLSEVELDNISKTSRLHYQIATDEHLFRTKFFNWSYGEPPKDMPPGEVSWGKIYRRNVALRFRPSFHPFRTTHAWRICGSYQDSFALSCENTSTIMGFPNGWTISTKDDLGFESSSIVKALICHCLLLPDGNLGIVYTKSNENGSSSVYLTTISMELGNIVSDVEIRISSDCLSTTLDFLRTSAAPPRVAILGGDNGEYLVFFENPTDYNSGPHVHVVLRSDGSLIHTWHLNQHDGFNALVRGESMTDDVLVVGVVRPLSELEYTIFPIEGGNEIFVLSKAERETLIDVVRNRDGNTFATRYSIGSADVVLSVVSEGKEWREVVGKARGTWIIPSCSFQLLANGSQVLFRPEALEEEDDGHPLHADGRIFHWRMDNETGQAYTTTVKNTARLNGLTFSWARTIGDGRILLAAAKEIGCISLFDLTFTDGIKVLRTLDCGEELNDICVVGNHYVVATNRKGGIYIWHFDKFCETEIPKKTSFTLGLSSCICPTTSWLSNFVPSSKPLAKPRFPCGIDRGNG